MSKKIRVLLVMCLLVLGMLIPVKTEAAAASKLKISGQTYPTSMKVGSYFSLKGTITSNYKIKRVTAGIYSKTGKTTYYRCNVNPRAKSYSLVTYADYMLKFDRLKKGNYVYKVSARDASGKTRTLVNKSFKVVDKKTTLKISNPSPNKDFSIKPGGYYTVGGKVTSNYKITQVIAKVVDASGNAKFAKTIKPNKKSYQISSDVDNAMAFNSLAAGTYQYVVTAKDNSGANKTLVKRALKVQADTGNGNTAGGGNSGGSNTGNFAKRTSPPPKSNPSYYSGVHNTYAQFPNLSPIGIKSGGVYVIGNCTWYAAGRAREVLLQAGKSADMTIFGGDPVGIWKANKSSRTYAYGNTPKVGSLVVFNYGSNGDAHIAMVEDILNGVPFVSESGYDISRYQPSADSIVFHYGSMYDWGGGRKILGYIYLI